MNLTLILGPMKSGKTYDLISFFAPLKYTNVSHILYQPLIDVRDEQIHSRNGVFIESKKVASLQEALDHDYQVVGVDEVHMFPESDAVYIDTLLRRGTRVIVSGLDIDYRRKMFGIIQKLFELGPTEVRYRKAVCEACKTPEAVFTQLYKDEMPITHGVPSVVPDDGTYLYSPVCRACYAIS